MEAECGVGSHPAICSLGMLTALTSGFSCSKRDCNMTYLGELPEDKTNCLRALLDSSSFQHITKPFGHFFPPLISSLSRVPDPAPGKPHGKQQQDMHRGIVTIPLSVVFTHNC